METAHVEAPEAKKEAELTFRERLGIYVEAVRIARVQRSLDALYHSHLENTETKSRGTEIKFSCASNTIELSSIKALDDQDETKTVIVGEWDWETERLCFASAYQSHFSRGKEVMVRQWDPNRYPKPEDQMKTTEILSELRTMSHALMGR